MKSIDKVVAAYTAIICAHKEAADVLEELGHGSLAQEHQNLAVSFEQRIEAMENLHRNSQSERGE